MDVKYLSFLLFLLLPLSSINAEISLTPPNAKAGECYAKVIVPAKYKTVQERVLIEEPSQKITIIPAKYEWIEKRVEIQPASKKLIVTPATFKKVHEEIEIEPAIRTWRVNLKRDSAPVSKEILVAAKLKGVDLDNIQPGTCYKEYFSPATYKTIEEEITLQKESKKIIVTPAKYETVQKSIIITPASKKIVTTPATYDYKEEKILVEEEKSVWKKGANPAQKLDGATGEIMCLVKIPAKYKTIKKRVVKTPATTKVVDLPAVTKVIKVKKLVEPTQTETVTIPAVKSTIKKTLLDQKPTFSWIKVGDKIEENLYYTGHQICLVERGAKKQKITKTILDKPATTKEVMIEPTYKTIRVKKLVKEAQEVKTPIKAVYKMISKKEKISPSHQKWQRILCQTNMNQEVIVKIQKALQSKGYHPGKIDGILGRDTRVALEQYQKENSLSTGGITYETLNSLKIDL